MAYQPFYLVWKDYPYDDQSEKLRPPDQSNLSIGHAQYAKYCQKCHALDGVGRVMGSEFNQPKNITEYW